MPEAALYWGLALLGVALILAIIDIFLPTGGILGVTSLVVAIAGVVLLFNHSTTWGIIGMFAVILGGPTAFFLGLRVMPSTPLGQKLVLGGDKDPEAAPPEAPDAALRALIGAQGDVVTDLRPIGTVRINGQRYDALAETTLIRAGSRVVVTDVVDGASLRVRAVA
jgi:membrane-bound ClpP family serine protease